MKNAQLFKQAPFGIGRVTKVDKAVRNTLEVEAKRLKITESKWHEFVKKQTAAIAEKFFIGDGATVEAKLYKFLVYEKGGMFRKHKDTEKEPGMFATMVVVLPCKFEGGDLRVEHAGTTIVYKPSKSSGKASAGTVLAWYADVDHEITKI